jgi:hypothetical protein
MPAPTTKRQPATSSLPSGKQAKAKAQRQAYNRRKIRAKVKSEVLRQKEAAQVEALPVQHPHAAGIDIGSRSHWVCVGFTTEAGSCLIQEFPAHNLVLDRGGPIGVEDDLAVAFQPFEVRRALQLRGLVARNHDHYVRLHNLSSGIRLGVNSTVRMIAAGADGWWQVFGRTTPAPTFATSAPART